MKQAPSIALAVLLAAGLWTVDSAHGQEFQLDFEAGSIADLVALQKTNFRNRKQELLVFLVPGKPGQGPQPLFVETRCASIDSTGGQGTGRSFKYRTEAATELVLRNGERVSLGGLFESEVAKVNRRGISRVPARIDVPEGPAEPQELDFKEYSIRLEVSLAITKGALEPGEAISCLTLVAAPSEPPEEPARASSATEWRSQLEPRHLSLARATAGDGTLAWTTAWTAVTASSRVNLKELGWLGTEMAVTDAHLGEDRGGPGYSSACTSSAADGTAGTSRVLRYDYELSVIDGQAEGERNGNDLLANGRETLNRKGKDSRTQDLQRLSQSLHDHLALEPPGGKTTVLETYDFKGRLEADQSLVCGTMLVAPALLPTTP